MTIYLPNMLNNENFKNIFYSQIKFLMNLKKYGKGILFALEEFPHKRGILNSQSLKFPLIREMKVKILFMVKVAFFYLVIDPF